MTVFIAGVLSPNGRELLKPKAFTDQKRADAWILQYVKDNWKDNFDDDPFPDDPEYAIGEYFGSGVVLGEYLLFLQVESE